MGDLEKTVLWSYNNEGGERGMNKAANKAAHAETAW